MGVDLPLRQNAVVLSHYCETEARHGFAWLSLPLLAHPDMDFRRVLAVVLNVMDG